MFIFNIKTIKSIKSQITNKLNYLIIKNTSKIIYKKIN